MAKRKRAIERQTLQSGIRFEEQHIALESLHLLKTPFNHLIELAAGN